MSFVGNDDIWSLTKVLLFYSRVCLVIALIAVVAISTTRKINAPVSILISLRSKRGQKIHTLSTFHAPLAHYWKGICMKLKMVQSITLHTLCICYTHCGKNQLFVYYFKSNYWNFFIDVQNTDIPEIKRFLKILRHWNSTF